MPTRENFAGRVPKIVRNQCARTIIVLTRAHAAPAEQFLRDKMLIEPAGEAEENFLKLGLLVVDALRPRS